jgi:hypothetical protein
MRCGAKIYVYMPGDSYCGAILCGSDLVVAKLSDRIYSYDVEELRGMVEQFDLHKLKLADILRIINGKLSDDKSGDLTATAITSARTLHNLMRFLKFSDEEITTIRKALMHLRFEQQLWNPTDDIKIVKATKAITSGEFLDDVHPIAWKTEAMFTKDPILSTLAAFGLKDPSPNGASQNYSTLIPKSGKYLQNKEKTYHFRGVPIFVKSLQDAFNDWDAIKKSSSICFKVSALDKDSYSKIPGATAYLRFDEKTTDAYFDAIKAFSIKEKEQTLKRKIDEITGKKDENAERKKKLKETTTDKDISLLAVFLGKPLLEDAGDDDMEV